MKKSNPNIYILLIVIAIIGVAYFLFFNGTGGMGGTNPFSPKTMVSCDITIGTSILGLGDLQIQNYYCTSSQTYLCNPFVVQPLGIFSNSGTLSLSAGNIESHKSITVNRLSPATFTLSICGNIQGNNGQIKVTRDGLVIDSKQITW